MLMSDGTCCLLMSSRVMAVSLSSLFRLLVYFASTVVVAFVTCIYYSHSRDFVCVFFIFIFFYCFLVF